MYGLAIKVQPEKYESAEDIILKHIETAENNNGFVHWSTGLSVDRKKKNKISSLILFSRDEDIYYLADVESISIGDPDTFVPKNSSEYSVEEYANTPRATWFLVKNIKQIDTDYLSTLVTESKIPLLDKLSKSSRFPRCYFCEK